MTAHQIAAQFAGHGSIDGLTTERNSDLKAIWVIGVLDLFF